MADFIIPAVCPTCGAVFAGPRIGESSSVSFDGCQAGPCPNGHMGAILDGTYEALDKLYAFFKTQEAVPAIDQIQRIARDVADKKIAADDGLADMADLLPKDLGTAVKKLGSKNPITAFLIVLAVISSMTLIGSNVATIYKTLSPNAPAAPTIIINNNPTNINTATAGHSSSKPVSHGPNRHERLKAKSLEAKANKRAGGSKAKAKDECEPRIDPTDPHRS